MYARFCRARGYNCVYVCGTDEYGTATETKVGSLALALPLSPLLVLHELPLLLPLPLPLLPPPPLLLLLLLPLPLLPLLLLLLLLLQGHAANAACHYSRAAATCTRVLVFSCRRWRRG